MTHVTRLRTFAWALHMLAGAACARPAADQPVPARSAADEARVRRCPASAPAARDPFDRAAACAEAFIARNGYTAADPVRADELAVERSEIGHPPAEVLAARRGSLAPRAYVVCRMTQPAQAGYKVAFTLLNMPTPRWFVTVEMNAEHSRLTVIHPTQLPSEAEAPLPPACRARGEAFRGGAG